LELSIKQSKTDPYRKGASNFLSKTNKDIDWLMLLWYTALHRENKKSFCFSGQMAQKLTSPIFTSTLATIKKKQLSIAD